MKRSNILASMLMALVAFTACSTDRDDNPVLQVPANGSFMLYAPGIVANTIDLDNSSSLTFKVDQPNYGYTAPITYMMEFAASEDGNTWSSWQPTETSNENPLGITLPTSEIASAVTSGLVELGRKETEFPLTAKVKARVRAFLPGMEETTSIYSNEVVLSATTSYVLPPIPSSQFYMVGALPGWNGAGAITALLFPEGGDVYTYTSKYTGAWDLKIWAEEDAFTENWDAAYGCEVDGDASPTGAIINENAQAISAPSAEYYTFTFDKHHMSYSWTKLEEQNPVEYEAMFVVGGFNGWPGDGGVAMTQVTPHNWYVETTIGEDTQLKFRANYSWDVNWGYGSEDGEWTVTADDFGKVGVGGAKNIAVNKGTYRFYINDITGKMLITPVE
jgi:hypothetical protein